MFCFRRNHAIKIAELESIVRFNEYQIETLRGEIERLATERNHLMDAVLRAVGSPKLYSADAPEPIEREVTRTSPAPRNAREFQHMAELDLNRLEHAAFS